MNTVRGIAAAGSAIPIQERMVSTEGVRSLSTSSAGLRMNLCPTNSITVSDLLGVDGDDDDEEEEELGGSVTGLESFLFLTGGGVLR